MISKSPIRTPRASISTLPPELLACVFVFCSLRARDNYQNWWCASGKGWGTATAWTRIRLVCRYWHEIADATPALWRSIFVFKVDWLRLCLLRSGEIPIELVLPGLYVHDKTLLLAHKNLLLSHTHRIRTLGLYGIRELEKSFLTRLLSNASALQSLHYAGDPGPLNISSQIYPRLRTLDLFGATTPRDPLIYNRLEELTLDRCACDLDFQEFIDVLSGAEHLQRLSLTNFLDQLSGSIQNDDYQAHLPQLALLKLESQTPQSSATFLAHVNTPALRKLKVDGYIRDRNIAEGFFTQSLPQLLPECLPQLLPEFPSERIPFLKHVSVAGLNVLQSDHRLSVIVHPSESDWMDEETIELSIESIGGFSWEKKSFGVGLQDLLRICHGAKLTGLRVAGNYNTVDQPMWSRVFRAFPMLETLRVGGKGFTTDLWNGLRIATSSPPSDWDSLSENDYAVESESTAGVGEDIVACPRLHTVDLMGVLYVDEDLFSAIIKCLGDRADRGVRLGTLRMRMSHNDQDQHYEDMKAEYLPALEALAETFEYHAMSEYYFGY